MKYTPIIGLEVHVELATKSKMFCGCSAFHFHTKPNTNTCPVCLGLPGALPVPNKQAIDWTILLGLALECEINRNSYFERKNYFYPDLAKGYQISQYEKPFCIKGKLKISNKTVRINRVHLEEDTGKLVHKTIDDKKWSLIDFNRSGVVLVEIVSEPDCVSSAEAVEYLKKLRRIIRYTGVSEADMEKGSMRLEPTVNLRIEKDNKTFYTPLVEVKNINSFNFAKKAIDFEIQRQLKRFTDENITKDNNPKETRGFNQDKGITVPQRQKESANDYRYFPEPDIPPFVFSDKEIEEIKSLLPELPDEKIARFEREYNLAEKSAEVLTFTQKQADFFESAVKLGIKNNIKAEEIAKKIINIKIDYKTAKPEGVIELIKESRAGIVTDTAELTAIVQEIVAKNPAQVKQYKEGKIQLLNFFLGQAMARTKGKADAETTRQIFKKLLS